MIATALAHEDEAWLDPAATRRLLAAYGIPLVRERVAATPEEAVAAAAELGFPAVVKTAEAGAHKTETGGVALDLGDAEAVRAAAERIGVPRDRAADDHGRRRAPRRGGAGSRSSARSSPSARAACSPS